MPTNCLNVSDHFVRLAPKGLTSLKKLFILADADEFSVFDYFAGLALKVLTLS